MVPFLYLPCTIDLQSEQGKICSISSESSSLDFSLLDSLVDRSLTACNSDPRRFLNVNNQC